jgi:tetratricopeptide (TPR) repeat protein
VIARAALALLLGRLAWSGGDFWARTADPGRAEYQRAMERGSELWDRLGALAGEDAVAAFREATHHSPRRPEGWLRLAEALVPHPGTEEEAIACLRRARALGAADPTARIAFWLGTLLARTGDLDGALREYQAAERADPSGITLGRAAGTLMALERLAEAIALFRRALSLGPRDVLSRWGLAVALDRDEQLAAALEAAREALGLDPALDCLTREDSFFVPEQDVYYYRALADEAAGRIGGAIENYRRFVEALPASPWVGRARRHIDELSAAREHAGRVGAGVPGKARRRR